MKEVPTRNEKVQVCEITLKDDSGFVRASLMARFGKITS